MRFKTFITEAAFSSNQLERVASLLTGAIGKKIGQTFWRMGGQDHLEKFKRDDGTTGVGISYILDNGRMVRFNLENDSDSSELSSVDVWKNLKNLSKPTMTLEIPSEFNSVEAVNTIATFIQSFKVTIREMFETINEGPKRKSKYDDRDALSKQYGVPEHLPDNEFRDAVVHAKKYLQLTGKQEISSLTQEIESAQNIAKKAKLNPETLFQDLEDLVYLVAKGSQPSLLVTGGAGTGKSHTVTTLLSKELGSEGKKWIQVKGKTSTLGLYGALFVNRNKLIIFDDCDSVFNNEDSINILKAALDSHERRMVSWISPATVNVSKMDDEQKEDLFISIESALETGDTKNIKFPDRFEFTGKIIFISNLPESKVDDAIKSRSFVIDMTLDREGMLTRMTQILPHLCKDSSMEDKQEVLDLLVQDGDKLNMRTFVGAVRIRESGNPRWADLVRRYA